MTSSGLLVVDKPGGMTSHDVVARVRRAVGTRKVGHAGTLDPMATGVLVVGVERATRLLGMLALRDKRYAATIRLGVTTLTDDADGEAVERADPVALATVTDEAIRSGLSALTGTIEQRPSAVSAIKVEGRRAYDRVRAGEDVELDARVVEVTRLDLLDVRPGEDGIDVDIDVECSTGTYVRAIARDLGAALGVGGHLTALRRTRVGPFTVADTVSLDTLAAEGAACIHGLDEVAAECFPVWRLTSDEDATWVRNGRRLPWAGPSGVVGPAAIVDTEGHFLALGQDDAGTTRFVAVFV